MTKPRVWAMNQDRAILLSGSVAIAGLAWWYIIHAAARMRLHGQHLHTAMDTSALFVMWAVMMVAMMLPSTLPFVFAFSAEQRRRRSGQLPMVPTAFFLAGYFALWIAFSAICASLQQLLHRHTLLSPMMSATSSVFAGTLLVAAGVYQWTPMKSACLRHCRSPFTFLLSDWKEGPVGALRMGIEHGLFCIGCCWMLMLLPFAAGVMNLLWMAGITVFLLLEKAAPGGQWIGRICGGALVLVGACVFIFAVAL